VTYNPDLKVTIIQRQTTRKWYNIKVYLRWRIDRKSHMIYQTALFSMTLNDPYPGFKVTQFLTLSTSVTVRDTDIVSIEY